MADPTSSGSEYADAVRDVLERVAQVDAAEGRIVPVKQSVLTKPPVMITVAVLFLGMVVLNLRLAQRAPEMEVAEAEGNALMSAYLAGSVIEQYRNALGTLPESLQEVGYSADQFEYIPGEDGHFMVLATVLGSSAVYDSRLREERLVDDYLQGVGVNRE